MKVPFRLWVLVIALLIALIAISPNPWAHGFSVISLERDSDVARAGLQVGDTIISVNGNQIQSQNDVLKTLSFSYPEQEVAIQTASGTVKYTITNNLGLSIDENLTVVKSTIDDIPVGEQIFSVNGVSIENKSQFERLYQELIPLNIAKIETDHGLIAYQTRDEPKFVVAEKPKSNLIFGLDFTGGTRVLLKPVVKDGEVTSQDIQALIDVLSNRLNVYGLSDVRIRSAQDWSGSKYVLVEIAGVTEQEVKDLIAQQGVFEAKIGESVVFSGSQKDIVYVCRNDGSCSGVRNCQQNQGSWGCTFEFSITLSDVAAAAQAEATKNLEVVTSDSGRRYLNKTIDFYLDGELVDSLQIGEDLKGQKTTGVLISGSGTGGTQKQAVDAAVQSMNKLQTILITGSLPFDLEIVKIDTVSPALGEQFLKNVLLVAFIAILVVMLVLYIRYRVLKAVLPVILVMVSELFLVLGFAAIVKWNLDMAAMAGLLAAIGTGVDDQIVILDESLRGVKSGTGNWKERLKRAFFVIFVAYAATVVALLPLWNAGAGLFRGFALTTIAGVTIGVFITRPAYGALIQKMYK